MVMPKTLDDAAGPRRLWRSTGAILCGLVAVVGLSLGTDHVLHVLDVYPPLGQPMQDPLLSLLALAYRIAYAILGSYLAAAVAPYAPMRHAVLLGIIGFVLSATGAIIAIPMGLGPAWYPITLALTALPCGWVGGALQRGSARRSSRSWR